MVMSGYTIWPPMSNDQHSFKVNRVNQPTRCDIWWGNPWVFVESPSNDQNMHAVRSLILWGWRLDKSSLAWCAKLLSHAQSLLQCPGTHNANWRTTYSCYATGTFVLRTWLTLLWRIWWVQTNRAVHTSTAKEAEIPHRYGWKPFPCPPSSPFSLCQHHTHLSTEHSPLRSQTNSLVQKTIQPTKHLTNSGIHLRPDEVTEVHLAFNGEATQPWEISSFYINQYGSCSRAEMLSAWETPTIRYTRVAQHSYQRTFVLSRSSRDVHPTSSHCLEFRIYLVWIHRSHCCHLDSS